MSPLTAYTDSLPDDVLLDTGILVRRPFDPEGGFTPIGVTRGGLEWNPNRELRNIDFDGKFFDIEELDRDIGGLPTFQGTFIQLGQSQLPIFESGVTSTTPGGGSIVTKLHTPKKAGLLFSANDYIKNLCLIYARQSGGYVQVRMKRALCTSYQWTGQHKNEAEIQATFIARQPSTDAASDLRIKPYVIEELSALS